MGYMLDSHTVNTSWAVLTEQEINHVYVESSDCDQFSDPR